MSRPTFLVLGGFLASEWEDIWQRQHEWTSALMSVGNVVYLERAAAGRVGVKRVVGRLGKLLNPRSVAQRRSFDTAFPAPPEFVSWTQIPWASESVVRRNARAALQAAEERRRALGWAPFSLVHVGTPSEAWIEAGGIVDAPVWFDSAERFLHSAAYADVPHELMERQVRGATLFTTDTEVTRGDWLAIRQDIHVIPHGAKAWAAVPDWTVARRTPYYVGSYHPALDTELLAAVSRIAGRRITLVGEYPAEIATEGLNLAGWAAGGDIPRLLSDATVGLVPYRVDPWCEGVYPSKVYDYFLAGIPAVSTRLPALDSLQWAWQVDTADAAAQAIARAEALTLDERRSIREFALANTWGERFERICRLLAAEGVEIHA